MPVCRPKFPGTFRQATTVPGKQSARLSSSGHVCCPARTHICMSMMMQLMGYITSLARTTTTTLRRGLEHTLHHDWFHRQQRAVRAMATPAGTHTSPPGSVINLVNGAVGAGILGMPLMFALMGWALGLLVLAVTCALGVLTTTAMVYVGIAEQTESYHMAVKATLGKWPFLFFQFVIIFGALGTMLACFILIGDFAQDVTTEMSMQPLNRRGVLLAIGVCVLLPLCLLKTLKALSFTGAMTLAFALFYTVSILFKLVLPPTAATPAVPPIVIARNTHAAHTTLTDFCQAFPIAVFSLSCHAVVFPVYHEMRTKTVKVWVKVASWTYGILFLVSAATGCVGFLVCTR